MGCDENIRPLSDLFNEFNITTADRDEGELAANVTTLVLYGSKGTKSFAMTVIL